MHAKAEPVFCFFLFCRHRPLKAKQKRSSHWKYDFTSPEQFSASVQANRELLAKRLGVVDVRAGSVMEIQSTAGLKQMLVSGTATNTYAVRWKVFDTWWAEGILIQPDQKIIIYGDFSAVAGHNAVYGIARLNPDDRTVAPMSVCGAMSEGYIGYDLQNAIREELLNRGIYKTVSTIITQVRVDPFDAAFSEPSKIIGRFMSKEEAEAEEEKGNHVVEEEPGKFRRIIAAPLPIDIYEIDAVKALLDADQIVIAAGGGGIPVLQQGTHLKGASAIIEKDYTAAKLAELVNAQTLLFLTAYDNLTIEKGTPNEKVFEQVSASDLHTYIKAGHFPAKTTFPKVDASIRFVTADSERKAVISNLDKAKSSLAGKTGTTITA